MDLKKLEEQLDIIFTNELNEKKGGSYRIVGISGLYDDRELLADVKSYEVNFPNLQLLIKLYQRVQSSKPAKKFFVDYLLKRTYHGDRFFNVRYLAFETLLKLGFIKEVMFDLLSKISANKNTTVNELMLLDTIIKHEYNIFTKEQLKYIKHELEYIDAKFSLPPECKLIARINQVFYLQLEKELNEEVNLQINQDKEAVITKISNFGFPEVLAEALNKIDQIYFDESKDEFDFSMAIGVLRQFWADLIDEVANRIKIKTGEDFPKSAETKTGNQRAYIKKHLSLKKEDDLIDGLVKILHKKGGHALISEREYFRLTRNITIEIALLILSKLEEFEAKYGD